MGFNGNGPSLDEIIDKHVAAMGGKAKLMSLATVRMEGNLTVQGTDVAVVFKLIATFRIGAKKDYYVDAQTYRISKASAKENLNGEWMDSSTTYEDYRQNADGYWFPYSTTPMRGATSYAKIDTNLAVDDNIFSSPG